MIKLAEDQRTQVTRWGSRIKKTGKVNMNNMSIALRLSGNPNRHITDLADGTEFHPRKGFRHLKKKRPMDRKEAAIAKEAARYKDGLGKKRRLDNILGLDRMK